MRPAKRLRVNHASALPLSSHLHLTGARVARVIGRAAEPTWRTKSLAIVTTNTKKNLVSRSPRYSARSTFRGVGGALRCTFSRSNSTEPTQHVRRLASFFLWLFPTRNEAISLTVSRLVVRRMGCMNKTEFILGSTYSEHEHLF